MLTSPPPPPTPASVREKAAALLFIAACFLWVGIHVDAFQNTFEQPFLESKGASLADFAAASSVEDIPWSEYSALFSCCSACAGRRRVIAAQRARGLRTRAQKRWRVIAAACAWPVRAAHKRRGRGGGSRDCGARLVRVRAGCALHKPPAACPDGVRNVLSRVSSRAGLKILFALPLDAGFCCSRIAGRTLGLRRPMILAGQLLATACLVLVFFVSPVTSLPFYQLVGFLRICGAAMIVIGVEGYATDASIVVFAGREALPSAAFQIGRNLGASIGQLAGGQLSSTRGFDAMLLLFLAVSASTMPVTLLVKELRAVPPVASALHRHSAAKEEGEAGVPPAQGAVPTARSGGGGGGGGGGGILATLAELVPVRLIAAWITRPSVLAFLLFNCVANVGVGLSTLYLVKFYKR